jgi:ubiquinone/menaquinone biosynthesis C-methylase UbiE
MTEVTDFSDPKVAQQYAKQPLIFRSVGCPQFLDLVGAIGGLNVLDLGCGNGYLTQELSNRNAHAVGIDVSGESIRHARQLYPSLDFREMDGTNLHEFSSSSFDKVIMFMVLLVVRDQQELSSVFRECRRVLKPGGELCFATSHPMVVRNFADGFRQVSLPPDGNYFESGMKYRVKVMLSDLSSMDITDIHWTLEDLSRQLEENGFVITKIREPKVPVENEHWETMKDELTTPYYLFVQARKQIV